MKNNLEVGKNSKKRRSLKRHLIVDAIILAAIAGFVIPGLDSRLLVQKYRVETEKVTSPMRFAVVSDLHSCKYGENQEELINAIVEENPDAVLMLGDIFDDEVPDGNTEKFVRGISGKYPCYYVTGNHECWSGDSAFAKKMKILEECGVIRLSAESAEFTARGETVNICGVDDLAIAGISNDEKSRGKKDFENQLKLADEGRNENYFSILLSHRPDFFELYGEYGFDLVLCGHAHGGQWRIPGVLNGLYAPTQGFFPKYVGGEYEGENMKMIVSRGLARESTLVPRLYNRPELVIIDVVPKNK